MTVLVIAFTSALLKGFEFYDLESVALLYGTSVTVPLLDDNDRFEYTNPMHDFNKINRDINDGGKNNTHDIDKNENNDENNNGKNGENNDKNDENDNDSDQYKNESSSTCNSDIDYDSKDDDNEDYNEYGISEVKMKESENFLFVNPMHRNKTFDNDKNSDHLSISNKSTPIKNLKNNVEKDEKLKKFNYFGNEESISNDILNIENAISLDKFDAKSNNIDGKNTEKTKKTDKFLDKKISTDFSQHEYNPNEYSATVIDNTQTIVPYAIIFAILGMWMLYAVLYVSLELSTKCTWGYFLLLTL